MKESYRKVDIGFLKDPKYATIAAIATGADSLLFECKSDQVGCVEIGGNFKYIVTVPHLGNYLRGFTFPLGADRVTVCLNDKEIETTGTNVQSLEFDHPVPIQRNANISIVYKLDPEQFVDRKVNMLTETAFLGFATIQLSIVRHPDREPDDLSMAQLEELLEDFVCE